MKYIDISRTAFQQKNMIPEVGDEVTLLWGQKIVGNILNGYGVIGTIRMNTTSIIWLNLGLSQTYQFPPDVNILYQPSDYSGLIHYDSIHAAFQGQLSYLTYSRRVAYALNRD